jgi:hypothetical protein
MVERSATSRSTPRPRVRSQLKGALQRLKAPPRQLRSHFLVDIGGETIAYCYIRKNACSAFKRMILDRAGYEGKWDDALQFLSRFAAPDLAAAKAARWRIYVYRDPFDRMVSLFRNKLIMQEGDRDFLPHFESISGLAAPEATFRQFVTGYLTRKPGDPHVRSQASHLLPIDYNCISTPETLFADMLAVVGKDLAAKYFAEPVNDSSRALFDEPSADVPVAELRERYAAAGELPASAALGDPELRAIIRRVYRDDYRLARQAAAARPLR